MSKMTKCKTCGADVAKSAKTCPQCGAKLKRSGCLIPLIAIALIVVIVIIVAATSGGSEEPHVSEASGAAANQTSAQTTEPAQSEEPQTVFGIGEPVELNGIVATLVSVTENNGKDFFYPADGNVYVLCEFEIENNSDDEITVSSILSFEAYADDYAVSLSIEAESAVDESTLDGTVAAGKKMHGIIGYEVPEDWSVLEMQFTPDFWRGKAITYQYIKGE